MMTLPEPLLPFTALDITALLVLLGAWAGVGFRIEHPGHNVSITVLMAQYRHAWMAQLLDREQRIFDAAILQNLRQGTAFFASTCLLSIGGVLALAGNPAPLEEAAARLPGTDGTALIWQAKLLLTVALLTSGFLRFVWAHRLFGYFSVVIGSIPNDRSAPHAQHRATQAAWLNTRAAINFNRGLRAIYFALASLAWLLGAYALIGASLVTAAILWGREFSSISRNVLIDDAPPRPDPLTKDRHP
ncbi:MAG: DUF599 domain-containing protein [Pseudomonadota bacterium]